MIQTEEIKLTQVATNPDNPRTITKEKFDKLVNSILIFPKMLQLRPIVVDATMTALGGNMRTEALTAIAQMKPDEMAERLAGIADYQRKTNGEQKALVDYWGRWLGNPTAYIVRADNLSEQERQQFIIKDNTQFGTWDYDALANKWDSAMLADWGMDVWPDGFEEMKVRGVDSKESEEDDFSDEDAEKAEPRVKPGDIWQLGEHRLMCGDSTDADSVSILMDGQKADMVLSDPPYGMHLDTDFSSCLGSLGRKKGSRGNRYEKVIGDNDDFSPALISTFFLNFNETKEMFIFGADYFAELLPNKNNGSWLVWDKRKESQADAIGSEFELIWSKNKHKRRVLRHDWFGFLSSGNSQDARNRVHPTQKPVTLLTDIINQWGKDVESIVDLYGGSGATLIACEQLHRRCYMMELDPHYCDVIIARWEKLTGKEAVKLND